MNKKKKTRTISNGPLLNPLGNLLPTLASRSSANVTFNSNVPFSKQRGVDRYLFSEGPLILLRAQDQACREVFTSESQEKSRGLPLQERFDVYVGELSEHYKKYLDSDAVKDYMASSLPSVMADYFGKKGGDISEYQQGWEYRKFLYDLEEGKDIPEHISMALAALVPSLVASTLLEVDQASEGMSVEDFSDRLFKRSKVFLENCLSCSIRVTKEGMSKDLLDNSSFSPELLDSIRGIKEGDILAAIISGNSSRLPSVSSYKAARSLGVDSHRLSTSRIGFDKSFLNIPVVDSETLPDGVSEFCKLEIPEDLNLLDPLRVSKRSLKVGGQNVSHLQALFGLSLNAQKELSALLTGDAALLLDEDNFNIETFETYLNTCIIEGRPLSGGEKTPFGYLISNLSFPGSDLKSGERGYFKNSSGYSLLKNKLDDKKWVTGPDAFKMVFDSIEELYPSLNTKLLDHQELLRLKKGHFAEDLSVSEGREYFLRNLGNNTLNDIFTFPAIPIVPVASSKSMQGEDGIQDPTHKTILKISELVDSLNTPLKNVETQLELQSILGYYFLGSEVYKDLPFSRPGESSGSRPWEKLDYKGIIGTLQGKHGMLTQKFKTSRHNSSVRMKISPTSEINTNEVLIPAYQYAVTRGTHVAAALRLNHLGNTYGMDTIKEELYARLLDVYGRNYMGSNMGAEMRSVISKFRDSVESIHGVSGLATLDSSLESIKDDLPANMKGEFTRLIMGDESLSAGLNVEGLFKALALHLTTCDVTSDLVDSLNKEWPVLFSRYPRLHHHSTLSLNPVISKDASRMTLSVNHLVANQLCLDYDGDAGELVSLILDHLEDKEQLKLVKKMLETHKPSIALFDSGSGTKSTLFLDLNGVEGLVKVGNYYNQGPLDDVESRDNIDEVLSQILPDKETLIKNSESPIYWDSLFKDFVLKLSVPGKLFKLDKVVEFEGGQSTLGREFYRALVERLVGDKVDGVFGPRFIPEGSIQTIDVNLLEKSLTDSALQYMGKDCKHNDIVLDLHSISDLFQNAQQFSGKLSSLLGNCISLKGETLENQLKDTYEHPLISSIRDEFIRRDLNLRNAYSDGILTDKELKSSLILAEQGSGFDSVKFESLRNSYLSEDVSFEEVSVFLLGQLKDDSIGFTSVLKAGCQLISDEYWKETGSPHVLQEQVLSAKIKAKPEILQHLFTGSVNIIQGGSCDSALGGLIGGQSVAGLLALSGKATHNAYEAKDGIKDPGEAYKDYKVSCNPIIITCLEPEVPYDLGFNLSEFFDSSLMEGNTHLLVQQLILGEVIVKDSPEWTKRLSSLAMSVPEDRKAFAKALHELYNENPNCTVFRPSPLLEKGSGSGVSARSVGCNPMRGIKREGDVFRRALFSEMESIGYPIGKVVAGAIGEDASQAQLKLRYTTGATGEKFDSLSDFWKVKYGPFPQHSAFGRLGAERTLSINPQKVSGGLSGYSTVFKSKGNFGEDCESKIATEILDLDGIQVFPGEKFQIINGGLEVGTDRPDLLGVSVDLNSEELVNSTKVIPLSYFITVNLDSDFYNMLKSTFPDKDGLTRGSVFKLKLDLEEVKLLLDIDPNISNNLKPNMGAEVVESNGGKLFETLGYYQVPEGEILNLGTPISGGNLINPRNGICELSQEISIKTETTGFFRYLDHLKGRPTHKQKAVLSPVSGEVTSLKFLEGKASVNQVIKYIAEIEDKEGILHDVLMPCVHPFIPVVQVGQKLDAADPVTQGYVDAKERCGIVGEKSPIEISRFVQGYFYETGSAAQLSINTEILAGSLFDDKGEFRFLKEMSKDTKNILSIDPQVALVRGNVDVFIENSAMGTTIPVYGKTQYMLPIGKDNPIDSLTPEKSFSVNLPKKETGTDSDQVNGYLSACRLSTK